MPCNAHFSNDSNRNADLVFRSLHDKPHYIDAEAPVPGLTVSTAPDSNKAAYVKLAKSNVRYCVETNIDYADSKSSALSISVGGRAPTVLISRELMFRACEFISNTNANDRMVLAVYVYTLEAIVRLSESHKGNCTAVQAGLRTMTPPSGTADNPCDYDAATKGTAKACPTPRLSSAATQVVDWSSAFDYPDASEEKYPQVNL